MSPPRLAPGLPVPAGRLTRLARFGSLAGGIAGGAALRGAAELARGRAPRLGDLLLTPQNARRLADELARMRGAAMKLGQLLSMDAGDLLPRELADILARLRAEAHPMPPDQLRRVLARAWGPDWLKRFARFDPRPIAAASIGQVHRAETRDGRDLAIKVQYPGVRRSIDSDVDNVATLIRLSGLAPSGVDLAPLLDEAKRQLHEEADYRLEGERLARFAALLADAPDYRVPALHGDLTTEDALAMDFVESAPIDDLVAAPQADRDRAAALLLRLLHREIFEFGLVQSDPNFANFRWEASTRRLVLLDFGATRRVAPPLADAVAALARAALAGDREGARAAALALGLFAPEGPARCADAVLDLVALVGDLIAGGDLHDFGDRAPARRLRDAALELAADRGCDHVPPLDTLFLQRKAAGVYLLAARLGARVDLGPLLAPFRAVA